MSFDTLGSGGLDYYPCRYGSSKLLFRGPKRKLKEPFVAFLGGTSTYGKFIERPFPELIEHDLGMTCVNFGCPNAGVDVITYDPFLRNVTAEARVNVVQVLSPRNMSNRFYTVHPRRNDRFLKPSTLLRTIYREVDFSQFNFTKHMLTRLFQISPARFQTIIDELQQAWCSRMRTMLQQSQGKTVLLWFSDHAPDEELDGFGRDPWLVTRAMLDEIQEDVAAFVEVTVSPEALAQGTHGMVFSEMEAPAAEKILGLGAHREAADALSPVIRSILKK